MSDSNTQVPESTQSVAGVGEKSFTTTWLLSLLLGVFGIDRFYLGKIGTGILKLVTVGGFGIWYLVDLIILLTGGTRDKKGLSLANEPQAKKKEWIISAAVIVVLVIAGSANANSNGSSSVTSDTSTVVEEEVEEEPVQTEEPVAEPEPEEPAAPVETTGQKNAKSKALDYLAFQSFSRQGLIDQLMFEGFSVEDSTYGTDASGADWNEQAALKAADYLEFQAFSRQGLIDQLIFEGFTQAEAEYGVSQNGY